MEENVAIYETLQICVLLKEGPETRVNLNGSVFF